ncbi:hypothetical protein [Bradyrhizobium sp. BWC-3-1]|uniref:hypothetical protein n=1 Tax=Bradyrhizobium sp. BWC-3-1 TaxID=3080012 RepID=UPI00293F74C4|nr:hypothetical protein [Bradyrhizobium sp. BWC-3-1]WOH55158.1 hypothetical protein RX329_22840 [Bradyrhizobium sp. BWC-3-1]
MKSRSTTITTPLSDTKYHSAHSFQMMTPEEYLKLAYRCRIALETVKDAFARQHLESMERSYRTLADSERALRKPGWLADALAQRAVDSDDEAGRP